MNLERFNFISNLMILILIFFGSLVWADSNGVWQDAKDVRGGTFGSDEQGNTSSFSFINPVFFSGVLTANADAIFNGNVGIGTIPVANKLEVVGTVKSRGSVAGYQFADRGGGEGFTWYSSANTARLYDHTAGVDRVVIDSAGKVGIGTTTPNTNLDVKGYITANADANYDVWIQGRSTGGLAGGNSRNLALLGVKGTDQLYVNYGSEYAGGTVLGTPVCIGGTCRSTWPAVSQTCPAGQFVKGFNSAGGIICGADQKTTGGTGGTGGGTSGGHWCWGTFVPASQGCGRDPNQGN